MRTFQRSLLDGWIKVLGLKELVLIVGFKSISKSINIQLQRGKSFICKSFGNNRKKILSGHFVISKFFVDFRTIVVTGAKNNKRIAEFVCAHYITLNKHWSFSGLLSWRTKKIVETLRTALSSNLLNSAISPKFLTYIFVL